MGPCQPPRKRTCLCLAPVAGLVEKLHPEAFFFVVTVDHQSGSKLISRLQQAEPVARKLHWFALTCGASPNLQPTPGRTH